MDGVPEGVGAAGALALALLGTALAVPPVRRLAIRTKFFDHPTGYKRHLRPTPYLGGAALFAGFLAGALTFGRELGEYAVLIALAAALLALGTLDDRRGLGVAIRFGVQAGAGLTLWWADLGWDVFASGAADLSLTVLWVVGIVNAFNLMDNLDGATGTVGGVCAAGVGAVALAHGDPAVGILAFALAGACAGFLPFNLARPSRIFLGDGGSMPIGVLIAALVMNVPHPSLGGTAVLAAAPLVGLPIFDTTLVVLSRWRRGAPVFSGARDHLTHRLFAILGSARAVAMVLALIQTFLCLLAAGMYGLQDGGVIVFAVGYLIVGGAALAYLESPQWARVGARKLIET